MASKMKSFKIFGYSIGLSKTKAGSGQKTTIANSAEKKRATNAIKKQNKREVSYQIADIRSALVMVKNADDPDRSKLHAIYEYTGRDGHLKSQIRLAKFKLKSEPWLLYNGETPDIELTKQFHKKWMSRVIEYILESEFHGYSVIELTVEEDGNVTVKLIDRPHVSIEKQLILIEATLNGPVIPYADVMWELDLVEFGERDDLGTLLECAYNVIWKYYSRSDWSRASEKWGMPVLKVIADTNDDAELDDMERRAANFGTDGYVILQKGDEAEMLERSGDNGHKIYSDNIALCNDEISKIINGQTGSSDQKAFVGSAEVHERVMDDFTIARMQNVVDEMNERFIPYLVYKGLLSEGVTFDYPELRRIREKKLNGTPTKTDPEPKPGDKKKEEDKTKDDPQP
jgi:hypothetical protein